MICRVLFIIVVLLSQSACGHLRGNSNDTPTVMEPASAGASRQAPDEVLADRPGEHGMRGTVPGSGDLNSAAGADLLDRIRAGFAFPDYQSGHIEQYEQWSTQHPTYLDNLFARAEPFLFYIVEEIEKRGLPTELALLPAVESAYKPDAVSASGASGLWQFIPSTGEHYGLREDWWYDGRRDAIAATAAALDYLTELNALFEGDWFLTLAAYNAGQGTVLRAIKANHRKHRKIGYRDLNLRAETVRYVPKLLALKNIIADPGKYGVSLPAIANQQHFEVIELTGQLDLHRFAEQAGIELAALRHLNAGYRRWATAPAGPHRLLVPVAAIERVGVALEELQTSPVIQYRDHRIRRGDTLSSIAKRYAVSVPALMNANQLKGTSIRTGNVLMVPIADYEAEQQVQLLSAKAQDTVAGEIRSPSAVAKPVAVANQLTHFVVAGDTLWSIARKYQVQVAQLLQWNKIGAQQILSLNQALTIFLQ